MKSKEIMKTIRTLGKVLKKQDKLNEDDFGWRGKEFVMERLCMVTNKLMHVGLSLDDREITKVQVNTNMYRLLNWDVKLYLPNVSKVLSGNEVTDLLKFIEDYNDLYKLKMKMSILLSERSGNYSKQLNLWLQDHCYSHFDNGNFTEYYFESREEVQFVIKCINDYMLVDTNTPNYYLSTRNLLVKVDKYMEKMESRPNWV